MYAVLRLNSIDSAKLEASADRLREFDKIHAAEPGYVGSVVVDWERRSALNLWDTPNSTARQPCKSSRRRLGGCSSVS
jgi:hypothetical protein